jgi:hypothetical protein
MEFFQIDGSTCASTAGTGFKTHFGGILGFATLAPLVTQPVNAETRK